jgi:hypothetical protein
MWNCPKCSTKVDQDFDICWNCGTSKEGIEDPSFVPADQAEPISDPMYDRVLEVPAETDEVAGTFRFGPEDDLVEAYQAFSLMESKFLADQLTANGIPAMSDTQDMQDFMGTMDGNPRVWVRRQDFDAARMWLATYEQKRNSDHGHPSHLHEG